MRSKSNEQMKDLEDAKVLMVTAAKLLMQAGEPLLSNKQHAIVSLVESSKTLAEASRIYAP